MTNEETIVDLKAQISAQQQALDELRRLVLAQTQKTDAASTTINRRRWLKRLVLAAGGLGAASILHPEKANAATASYSDSTFPVLSVTYTGAAAGRAIDATVNSSGISGSSAVRAINNGGGYAVYAATTGTFGGPAVYATSASTDYGPTIFASNSGIGNGVNALTSSTDTDSAGLLATNTGKGYGIKANTSATGSHAIYAFTTSSNAAIRADNNGSGYGVYATTGASGKSAVYATSANPNDYNPTIYASNTGIGNGVNAFTSSTDTDSAGVLTSNYGKGCGVRAYTDTNGSHAIYARTSSTNTTIAAVQADNGGGGYGIYAKTGTSGGPAVYAISSNPTDLAPTIYAKNNGIGNGVTATTSSTDTASAGVLASNYGKGYGIRAYTDTNGSHAVYASTSSTASSQVAAIYADAIGKANGIYADTTPGVGKAAIFASAVNYAPLHLMPAASGTGAPATGAHTKGEFYVDSAGSLWYCYANGTPGTWVNLSNSTSTAPVYTPVTPFRLVDSVNGTTYNPAGLLTGFETVANANTTKKTYQVNSSPIPTTAKSIFGYAYVHQDLDKFKVEPGYGYLTLWKFGDTYPQVVPNVEGLNTLRYIKGAAASTFFCVPLGSGKFLAASKYSTHLAIDITGYFA